MLILSQQMQEGRGQAGGAAHRRPQILLVWTHGALRVDRDPHSWGSTSVPRARRGPDPAFAPSPCDTPLPGWWGKEAPTRTEMTEGDPEKQHPQRTRREGPQYLLGPQGPWGVGRHSPPPPALVTVTELGPHRVTSSPPGPGLRSGDRSLGEGPPLPEVQAVPGASGLGSEDGAGAPTCPGHRPGRCPQGPPSLPQPSVRAEYVTVL